MKQMAMQRFSKNQGNSLKVKLVSVVSNKTGENIQRNDKLNGVYNGGIIRKDLVAYNVKYNNPKLKDADTSSGGVMFLKSPRAGYNTAFSPRSIAEHLDKFADTTPEQYLAKNGAQKYMEVFGTATPLEAKEMLKKLKSLTLTALANFEEGDIILDYGNDHVVDLNIHDFTPVLEKVIDVKHENNVTILTTQRDLVNWSHLYRYGNSFFNLENGTEKQKNWLWPSKYPYKLSTDKSTNVELSMMSEKAIIAANSYSSEVVGFSNLNQRTP